MIFAKTKLKFPLIALFLTLQRYWRLDLISGAVKS